MANEKLKNIQGLRGLAALGVFIFHSLPYFQALGLSIGWFETLFSYGYIGVDIFFVISGLVMAITTHKKTHSISTSTNFLKKRILRIFLGYWPVFLVAVLLILIHPEISLARYDFWGSLFLVSLDVQKLIIPTSWSLNYELYFYFLLALLLCVSKQMNRVFLWILTIVVLIHNSWIQAESSIFFLSSYILEFLAGYGLFFILNRVLVWPWMVFFLVIGVIGGYLMTGIFYRFEGLPRVFSVGLLSVTVVYFAMVLESKYHKIIPAFIRKIGDASYTLYLIHMVLLYLFNLSGLITLFANASLNWLIYLLLISSVVVVSLVLYRFVERPFYHYVVVKIAPKES